MKLIAGWLTFFACFYEIDWRAECLLLFCKANFKTNFEVVIANAVASKTAGISRIFLHLASKLSERSGASVVTVSVSSKELLVSVCQRNRIVSLMLLSDIARGTALTSFPFDSRCWIGTVFFYLGQDVNKIRNVVRVPLLPLRDFYLNGLGIFGNDCTWRCEIIRNCSAHNGPIVADEVFARVY